MPVGPEPKIPGFQKQKKKDTLKQEAAIDMTARQGSRNSSRELGKLKRESTARKASAVVKGLLAWGPLYQAGAGINVCVFFLGNFCF